MGRENWQGKDDRERTPFTYLLDSGAWFQTTPGWYLFDAFGELFGPAIVPQTVTQLRLFLFGQDYLIRGYGRQLFLGTAELNPTPPPSIGDVNPDHSEPILPDNSIALHTYLSWSRMNWGHLEMVRAQTVTNGVDVAGWPATLTWRQRNYLDIVGDPLEFVVDGWHDFAGDVKAARPYQSGAQAGDDDPAVTGQWSVIIPESSYTEAMQRNNHWIANANGDDLYIVGLWQGIPT